MDWTRKGVIHEGVGVEELGVEGLYLGFYNVSQIQHTMSILRNKTYSRYALRNTILS